MRWIGWVAAAAFVAATSQAARATDIELLRRPEIGSSQLALDAVKKFLATKKFDLRETTVDGADDDAFAKAVAKSGASPAAALVNGDEIRALGDQRDLGDITANALTDHWAGRILDPVQPLLMSSGRWVAAPLDVMPINGLWVNAALIDKIGGAPPDNLDLLFALLARAKQADIAPLAIGGDPRDIAALFEMLVVATAGADIYKRVFVDIDEQAAKSVGVKDAFENLARLRAFVSAGDAAMSSKEAAQQVADGRALAFVGPGSTRLLFAAAGKVAEKDYQCFRFPGTKGTIIYQADLIAMLKASPNEWPAQAALADAVMDPGVQAAASLARGAVPVRGGDVDLSKFDACARKDVDDVQQAAAASAFSGFRGLRLRRTRLGHRSLYRCRREILPRRNRLRRRRGRRALCGAEHRQAVAVETAGAERRIVRRAS